MTEVEAQLKTDRTYALAMNLLDFGRFLAGCAREKSSNCVSPNRLRIDALAMNFLNCGRSLAGYACKKSSRNRLTA